MPPSAFLLFLITARSGGPRDTKGFTEICGCIDWEPALLQSRAHPHVPVSWMELALWGSWDWQLIKPNYTVRPNERAFVSENTPTYPGASEFQDLGTGMASRAAEGVLRQMCRF